MKLRSGSPREAGMLPERIDRARDRCAAWVKDGHTSALSACVARRGVVALHESYGVLGPEAGAAPIDPHSLFPVSSLTKPVTATLVMQLVEDGLMGLNRPVLEYIPEIQAEGAEEMLVHHLLTHTSGYVWYDEEPFLSHAAEKVAGEIVPPEVEPNQHLLHALVIQLFLDAPLACRPGERMMYSNHNYELLSEIVRRVSGRPHWELARERIFEPLGMADSTYIVPEEDAARVVRRPENAPGGAFVNALNQGISSRQSQETPFGGGGVFSTARDMAAFAQMFLNGGRYGDERILTPASVAAMTRDQVPGVSASFLGNPQERAGWGYGWGIETETKWRRYRGSLRSLGSYDHGGLGGVFMWADPPRELVGVYFEVCLEMIEEQKDQLWNSDLFQDVVTAAVDD